MTPLRQRDPSGNRRFALGVLVLTAVFSLTAAARHRMQMRDEAMGASFLTWGHALWQEVPHYALWALAAFPILWFTRRVPLGRTRWVLGAMAYAGFGLVMVVAHGAALTMVYTLFGSAVDRGSLLTELRAYASELPYQLPGELFMYVAVVGMALAYDYYRRYRERELAAAALATQLAEARLHALRMQLNPHFLFNTMNSIAMLVRGQRNAEAVRTITGLSDLLREVLDEEAPAEVTLRAELDFVRRYLDLERIRFGDRLQVRVDVSPEALEARVPKLLLQPLVENAIRHGVSRRASAGRVEITGRVEAGRLALAVRDDGPGPDGAPSTAGNGVGLGNIRNRLAARHGAAASLSLGAAAGGGAVASIAMPYVRDGA